MTSSSDESPSPRPSSHSRRRRSSVQSWRSSTPKQHSPPTVQRIVAMPEQGGLAEASLAQPPGLRRRTDSISSITSAKVNLQALLEESRLKEESMTSRDEAQSTSERPQPRARNSWRGIGRKSSRASIISSNNGVGEVEAAPIISDSLQEEPVGESEGLSAAAATDIAPGPSPIPSVSQSLAEENSQEPISQASWFSFGRANPQPPPASSSSQYPFPSSAPVPSTSDHLTTHKEGLVEEIVEPTHQRSPPSPPSLPQDIPQTANGSWFGFGSSSSPSQRKNGVSEIQSTTPPPPEDAPDRPSLPVNIPQAETSASEEPETSVVKSVDMTHARSSSSVSSTSSWFFRRTVDTIAVKMAEEAPSLFTVDKETGTSADAANHNGLQQSSLKRPTRPSPLPLIAGSIDSHVPTLSSMSPTSSQSATPVIVPAPQVERTSAWDPLRPRLSLPLLGRQKIPLEVALGTNARSRNPPPTSQTEDERPSTPLIVVEEAPGTNYGPELPTVEQEFTDAPPPASSSWWSFLAMASPSASRSETPRPPESDGTQSSANSIRSPSSPSQSLLEVPTTIRHLSRQRPPEPSSSAEPHVPSPSSSVWYMPWSRAGASPAATSEHPNAESSGEGRKVDGKTEAELIKEAALLKDSALVTHVSSPPSDVERPSSPSPSVSPLLSPKGVKSSWISFFSSASTANYCRTKAITDKAYDEGDGMEVMEIPDDVGEEDQNQRAQSNSATSAPVAVPPPRRPSDAQPSSIPSSQSVKTGISPPEPGKKDPKPPLTDSDSVRKKAVKPSSSSTRSKSPSPSTKSKKASVANLVLPTFDDTFRKLPRSRLPTKYTKEKGKGPSMLKKTMRAFGGYLLGVDVEQIPDKSQREAEKIEDVVGQNLPRLWDIVEDSQRKDQPSRKKPRLERPDVLRSCKRVVCIGVHGWFPSWMLRTLTGEPTGTSSKFASMMTSSVEAYAEEHGFALQKVTTIPLEGEGKIADRVQKLYSSLTSNEAWMEDIHEADVIFVVAHSQGAVVSTEILDKLITDGHVRTPATIHAASSATVGGAEIVMENNPQHLCCLALCGIHLGPLVYLSESSFAQPYLQYFESAAALELFEFNDTGSDVFKTYTASLNTVLQHGVKFVYVASLNDQVVPIYSGVFTAASHPSLLRALYIDGDAYSSSDFLSNLLVLLFRIRNAGLDDNGLIAHLSEATAGTLGGVGHSTAYEEPATYNLAVRFLFETTPTLGVQPDLHLEPFSPKAARNDYEIPWALRELIAEPHKLFVEDWHQLAHAFDEWQPKTTILRDMKRKLQPIQRMSRSRL
ncbi:hypothetical protein SISNIDRAFT_452293, partial [Sistotremastrum niveocremeum HHB9708]